MVSNSGAPFITAFFSFMRRDYIILDIFLPSPKGSFCMNSFPPVTPIVCRHRNGEARDPGAPCRGPSQTAHLLHLATSWLLVLAYLDTTMSFVMRSHALISNVYSSFGFLWGSPHPCLVFLWRPFRPHFHFLNVEY